MTFPLTALPLATPSEASSPQPDPQVETPKLRYRRYNKPRVPLQKRTQSNHPKTAPQVLFLPAPAAKVDTIKNTKPPFSPGQRACHESRARCSTLTRAEVKTIVPVPPVRYENNRQLTREELAALIRKINKHKEKPAVRYTTELYNPK